jgi:hypothetical protein
VIVRILAWTTLAGAYWYLGQRFRRSGIALDSGVLVLVILIGVVASYTFERIFTPRLALLRPAMEEENLVFPFRSINGPPQR